MRATFIVLTLGAMIVFGGLKVLRVSVENDLKDSIASEFQLPDEGVDFVLECMLTDEDLGLSNQTAKRAFCGCLGTRIARTLNNRDLEVAAFVLEQNRKSGIKIPTSSTARTPVAARVAGALESGKRSCRSRIG